VLDDVVGEGDLAVAGHDDAVVAADAEDGGGADKMCLSLASSFPAVQHWPVFGHKRNFLLYSHVS